MRMGVQSELGDSEITVHRSGTNHFNQFLTYIHMIGQVSPLSLDPPPKYFQVVGHRLRLLPPESRDIFQIIHRFLYVHVPVRRQLRCPGRSFQSVVRNPVLIPPVSNTTTVLFSDLPVFVESASFDLVLPFACTLPVFMANVIEKVCFVLLHSMINVGSDTCIELSVGTPNLEPLKPGLHPTILLSSRDLTLTLSGNVQRSTAIQ